MYYMYVPREGEEGCKKQLGRVLSIWQERTVYENNLLDQLSQVLCKFTQYYLVPAQAHAQPQTMSTWLLSTFPLYMQINAYYISVRKHQMCWFL